MILVINTAEPTKIQLFLVKDRLIIIKKQLAVRFNQTEKLLPAIDKLIKLAKSSLVDLRGIGVVVGPGPFTAVRVGVATANALALALHQPVVSLKLDEIKDDEALIGLVCSRLKKNSKKNLATPLYDKEPNITKKKV